MFTGIIQEVGRVARVRTMGGGRRITFDAPQSAALLSVRDSVAVNGVCLTIIERSARSFTVEVVEESLKKTTLGTLASAAEVNLELPLKLGDRVGGHLVLGHIDGVGAVAAVKRKENSRLVTVKYPPEFAKYVIPVGSIAVDGVSLTVASAQKGRFTVSLIPYTLEHTTFSRVRVGSKVNLEFDLLGKYVENFVLYGKGKDGGELAEKLKTWGYLEST